MQRAEQLKEHLDNAKQQKKVPASGGGGGGGYGYMIFIDCCGKLK